MKIYQPTNTEKYDIPSFFVWLNCQTCIKDVNCLENEILEMDFDDVEEPTFLISSKDEIAIFMKKHCSPTDEKTFLTNFGLIKATVMVNNDIILSIFDSSNDYQSETLSYSNALDILTYKANDSIFN